MNYYSYYASPIGTLKIEANEEKLISIQLLYKPENLEENQNYITIECKKQLGEYFNKERKKFDLNYELNGTEFQCKVWKELSKIEYGTIVTYKEIARKIHHEKAVRAVANAIGKNPLLIVLPCHRVIGSNGKLTGFSAETEKMNGLEIKAKLLEIGNEI